MDASSTPQGAPVPAAPKEDEVMHREKDCQGQAETPAERLDDDDTETMKAAVDDDMEEGAEGTRITEGGGEEEGGAEASEATVSEGGRDDDEGADGEDVSSKAMDPNLDYGDYLQQQYNELLAKLQAYKDAHGNCSVPRDWQEDPKLGSWVHEQRDRQRKGNLSKERYEQLSELGFVWESQNDIVWKEKYKRLVAYKDAHGDCVVPGNYTADPALAVWVKYQRDAKRRGRLGDKQIALLEELGFQWELTLEKQWMDKMEKLRVYHETYGDCNVPYNFSEDPALGMWVKYQRDAKRRGRLNPKYLELLDELSFSWEPALDKQWNDRFEKLCAFRREYGHACVPKTYKDQALVSWTESNRDWYRTGKLSKERVQSLEELGFYFEVERRPWDEMYELLLEFRRKHGDSNVPLNWAQDPLLAAWVWDQRGSYRKGRLATEQKQKLDKIDFKWTASGKRKKDPNLPSPANIKSEPGLDDDETAASEQAAGDGALSAHKRQKQEEAESQWGRAFARLEEYREANGDCDVPRDFPDDPALGSWAHEQRDRHRKGSLGEERMQKLDRLGFQWRTQADIAWDEQFARFEAYRAKYGDCQVPHNFAEDQKLSNWVSYQKERIRKGKMPNDRLEKLKGLDFEWEPLMERQWNSSFEKLQAFKEANGHCNVPLHWAKDPHLGTWVAYQRERRRKGKLPPALIQRLLNLGFCWESVSQQQKHGQGQQLDEEEEEEEEDNNNGSKQQQQQQQHKDDNANSTVSEPRGASAPAAVESLTPGSRRLQRHARSSAVNSEGGESGYGADGVHQDPQSSFLCFADDDEQEGSRGDMLSVAAGLRNAAKAVSSFAGQMGRMWAAKQELGRELKRLQELQDSAKRENSAASQKIAAQEEVITALERRLEVMTSALERAEQQISAAEKEAAAAKAENERLHRAALQQPPSSAPAVNGNGNNNNNNGDAAEATEDKAGAASAAAAAAAAPSQGLLCISCRQQPPKCVVMPCMHFLHCRECLDKVHKDRKVCPGCETPCLSVMDVQLTL